MFDNNNNNNNKWEAKLDNYVRILCPTMYIFMIYAVIFVAGVLLVDPWKLSSEIFTCLGSNNKKCRNVVTILWTEDAISNAGTCRENAYVYH